MFTNSTCILISTYKRLTSQPPFHSSLFSPEEGLPYARKHLRLKCLLLFKLLFSSYYCLKLSPPLRIATIKNLAMSRHRGQDYRQHYARNPIKDQDQQTYHHEERTHHQQQRPRFHQGRHRDNRGQTKRPQHQQRQGSRRRTNQGHPIMSPLDEKLLNLRKKYKNISLNYLNMQTQATFLTACLQHHLTPRGLRIRLRCMTPKRSASNIEEILPL